MPNAVERRVFRKRLSFKRNIYEREPFTHAHENGRENVGVVKRTAGMVSGVSS